MNAERLAEIRELRDRHKLSPPALELLAEYERREQEGGDLTPEDALRRIAEQRPETLETIRRNGFAFTDIGTEPGNWQHLAFSLYTTICEIDLIARAALGMRVGE